MPSLVVSRGPDVVFQSDGRWLHPLIELERWLEQNPMDPAELALRDRIIGTGAAFLIRRLGFRTVSTPIVSKRAKALLEERGVVVAADTVVDRIACSTEAILADVEDDEAAHRIILSRIARPAVPGRLLSVRDLRVVLGGKAVLEAVDLDVSPGEVVLIHGENGSGKTTLLRAVAGLLPVQGGSIERAASLAGPGRIAYLPQRDEPTRLPISARELVMTASAGRRARGGAASGGSSPARLPGRRAGGDGNGRAVEALEKMGVAHLADRPVRELSGGESRRVAMARALAQGAELILLDEPTKGMDAASRVALFDLLRTVVAAPPATDASARPEPSAASGGAAGRAVLLVSHDVGPEVAEVTRSYELHRGVLLS